LHIATRSVASSRLIGVGQDGTAALPLRYREPIALLQFVAAGVNAHVGTSVGLITSSLRKCLGPNAGGPRRYLDIGAQNLYDASADDYREFVRYCMGVDTLTPELDRACISLAERSNPRTSPQLPWCAELFELVGWEYQSVDMHNGTIEADLNVFQLDASQIGYFDFVVNAGTTEHVLNQQLAMRTIHYAAREGGFIMHFLPSTGTYNPKFFLLLAQQNHYKIVHAGVDYQSWSNVDARHRTWAEYETAAPLLPKDVMVEFIFQREVMTDFQGCYDQRANDPDIRFDFAPPCRSLRSGGGGDTVAPEAPLLSGGLVAQVAPKAAATLLPGGRFVSVPPKAALPSEADDRLVASVTLLTKILEKCLGPNAGGPRRYLDIEPQQLHGGTADDYREFARYCLGVERLTTKIDRACASLANRSCPGSPQRPWCAELFDLVGWVYQSVGRGNLDVYELGPNERGSFDFVANFGATEHVLNQFVALSTLHEATRAGGFMIHFLPTAGFLYHGILNYNPKFFLLLGHANAYKIIHAALRKQTTESVIDGRHRSWAEYGSVSLIKTEDVSVEFILQRTNTEKFRVCYDIRGTDPNIGFDFDTPCTSLHLVAESRSPPFTGGMALSRRRI
jgi:hypothetical protein